MLYPARRMPQLVDGRNTLCGIAGAWAYSSGGMRLHCATTATKVHPFYAALIYDVNNYHTPWTTANQTTDPNIPLGNLTSLSRGVIKHLNSVPTVTFEMPGYGLTPYAPSRGENILTNPFDHNWGSFSLFFFSNGDPVLSDVKVMFGVSAGDDFTVYFPCGTPVGLQTPPELTAGNLEHTINYLTSCEVDLMGGMPVPRKTPKRLKKKVVEERHVEVTFRPADHLVNVEECQMLSGKCKVDNPVQVAQLQGFDLFDEIVGIIESINETVRGFMKMTGLAKQAVKIFEFLRVVCDDVLPIITAAHTLCLGDTVARGIAAASLVNIITRYVSRSDKLAQSRVKPFTKLATQSACTVQERDGSVDTDEVQMLNLKMTDYSDILKNPYDWLVNDYMSSWMQTVCQSFGYLLPRGFKKYIRRTCKTSEGLSFQVVLRCMWHTLLYVVNGDELNEEWERAIVKSLVDVIGLYTEGKTKNYWDYESLDSNYPGRQVSRRVVLNDLWKRAKNGFQQLPECRMIPSYITVQYHNFAQDMAKIDRLDTEKVTQPEPTTIMLLGSPGTGKSMLLASLIPSVVLKRVGLKKPSAEQDVYMVPVGEKQQYWDGYEGQPFVLYDEFLQGRDCADALEFIRVVNTVCMPINKAHLSDKERRFRSHFVGVTSNATSVRPAAQAVHSTDAIVRRIPFQYKLKLNPEYALKVGENKFLNKQKLDEEIAVTETQDILSVLDKVWTFRQLNFATGEMVKVDGAFVDRKFSDIVDLLVAEYERRKTMYYHTQVLVERLQMDGEKPELMRWTSEELPLSEDELYDDDAETTGISSSTNTMLMQRMKRMRDNMNYSKEACSDTMTIVLRYNSEELGFDDETFKRLCSKRDGTPFQKMYGVKTPVGVPVCSTHSMPAFMDFVWQHSSQYETKLGKAKRHLKPLLKWVAIALGATSAAYAILRMINTFLKKGTTVLQSYTGKWTKPQKADRVISGAIPQMKDDVQERIRGNLREIVISNGVDYKTVQALCLDQKYLVIPEHFAQQYFQWKREGFAALSCHLTCKTERGFVGEKLPIYLGTDNSTQLKYKRRDTWLKVDARLVCLRTEFIPRAKSIWHFVNEGELDGMIGTDQQGVILNHECREQPGSDYPVKIEYFGAPSYMEGACTLVCSAVRYTNNGDCGLPYLAPSRFQKPIVGIHAWLTSTQGILGAAPLTLAVLTEAKERIGMKVIPVEKESFPVTCEEVQNQYWTSNMELVGTGKFGDWTVSHFTPASTKFVRATYKGVFVLPTECECDYLPAVQQPMNGKHPLFSNCQKYEVKAFFSVNVNYHEHAVNHFSTKYERERCTRVFTLDEAINGVPPMQPVRTDTSSGFWTEFGFKEGKKHFLKALPQEYDVYDQPLPIRYELSDKAKQHEVVIFHQTFEQRLEACDAMIRSGIAPLSPWISTTKDELLAARKIDIVKTRVFEQPGFEYTLLVRKYFGAFLNYYKERAGFVFYHGIGRDKEEVWAEYWKEFNRVSPFGVDYDYANYDGTVCQSAFQFFSDVVENYYHDAIPEERRARAALLDMLRETYHILGRQFAYSVKGNKSGNPFTDVFNSVTNTYVQYIAFMATVQGKEVNLQLFDDAVRMLSYGDDIIQSIRPDLLKSFNGRRVQAALKTLGYELTDARKSEVMPEYSAMTDLTFLKSPFVERDGVTWAPLPLKDVYKELKYRPKQWEGNDEDLRLRLMVVQKFLCHHGPDRLKIFQGQMCDRGIPRTWLAVNYDVERNRVRELQESAVLYTL